MLWSEKDDESAKHNLRQLVSRLRKLSFSDAFDISDTMIKLDPEKVTCDLWQYREWARSAVADDLSRAVALHRGAFCQGLDIHEPAFEEWLSDQRMALQTSVVDSCVSVGQMELRAGMPTLAISHARQAIAMDALREDAHRVLMQALVFTDRRSEAIQHYDNLAAMLEREIDSDPDELTQALAVSLKQESGVSFQTAPATSLTLGSHEWVQSLSEEALETSTPAVLVVQCEIGSPFGESSVEAFAAYVLLQGAQPLQITRSNPHEMIVRAESVRMAAKAGLWTLQETAPSDVRMGLHPLIKGASQSDALQTGIQVARQLCQLAKPGEILLSLDAREQLVTSLDVEVRDLGEQSSAPKSEPLRMFAIQPSEPNPAVLPSQTPMDLMPTIAVIPFTTFAEDPSRRFLGDLLADEMIGTLSKSPETRVISRLSTSALAGRKLDGGAMAALLGASYAASGSCYVVGDQIRLTLEFSELASNQILFLESLNCSVADVWRGGGIVDDLARRMSASVIRTELRRSRMLPFASLSNSTLMLGAVAMMHQLSQPRFELSRQMLETLIERDSKHPTPYSWLAMYRLLKVSQGWSDNAEKDAALASDDSNRALDLDPDNSLALAVDAHIHTQFHKDLPGAQRRLNASLVSNPNNGLAWLFKSTMHAFNGQGVYATEAAQNASRLSPLDPRRWFYDSLGATAALGAEQFEDAIMLAKRSIQANATHTSTYRALAIAQSLSGKMEDAQTTVRHLMQLQPGLKVADFRSRHPTGESGIGSQWANALQQAGVPG